MRLIKALIIDSNADLINQLTTFAEENSVIIEICGVSNSLEEGIELVKTCKPELLFLDPTDANLNSFVLMKELDFNIPKFVFIADDESKAYQGYKYNAVDFQKKPLDYNELIISIYKVIKLIEMEISFQNQKVNQIKGFNFEANVTGFIAISSSDKIELIKLEDIVYCKAEGKYTEVVLSSKQKILSSKNLGEFHSTLYGINFFRVHHSYVVNVNHVLKISKKNGLYCEFGDGISIPVAKRRQDVFIKFLKL